MGSKSGGRGPAPPDPRDVARGATGTNIATAIANLIGNTGDVSGPFGSTTRTQSGTYTYTDPYTGESYEIPIFDTQTQLSDTEQGLYEQGAQTRGALGGAAARTIAASPGVLRNVRTTEAAPGLDEDVARGASVFNPDVNVDNIQRDRVEDALRRRLAPQREANREALQVSQAARGVGGAGGAIADREFLRQRAAETDQDLAITAAGGQEQALQSNLASQDLQRQLGIFGANEAARQAQFQRGASLSALKDRLRSGGLNRIVAAAHAAQPITPGQPGRQPFFAPTTDVAGIIGQNYQQQLQRSQQGGGGVNPLGGLFGLASLFF